MRLAWIAGWIVLWLRSVGSATIRLTCSGDLGEEDCAPLTVACLASAIDRVRACSATITTDRIGETAAVLDEFLMPRLAWRVVSEPDERAADGVFVIERLPPAHPLASALRLIEEVQFPSEAELAARCSSIMHLPAAPRYFGLLMATLGAQSMAAISSGMHVNPAMPKDWRMLDASVPCSGLPAGATRAELDDYIARHRPCSGRAPNPLFREFEAGDDEPDLPFEEAAPHQLWCYFLPMSGCPLPAWAWLNNAENCDRRGANNRVCVASNGSRACAARCVGADDASARALRFADALREAHPVSKVGLFMYLALRLNRAARLEVRARVRRWRRANPEWATHARGDCAVAHVRHGDKLTHRWNRLDAQRRVNADKFNRSLADYARVASAGLRARAAAGPSSRHVLVMTDDLDIVRSAPRVADAERVKFFHVTPGRPLTSLSNVSARSMCQTARSWAEAAEHEAEARGCPKGMWRQTVGHANGEADCQKDLLHARETGAIARHAREVDPAFVELGDDSRSRAARARFRTLPACERSARIAEAPFSTPGSCAFDYTTDPVSGEPVGSQELMQWLVAWTLMSECSLLVAVSIEPSVSHFTSILFEWMCTHSPELECPAFHSIVPAG